MSMSFRFNIKKVLAGALGAVFFVANCAFAHATETNFWASRRTASQRMRTGSDTVMAGESGYERTLLAQLPKAEPLELGGHSAPFSQKASGDVKVPFAIGPKTGDWLGKLVMPYGTVQDIYLSPKKDAPFIVHIQDAHGIEEAQRNISSMIGLLGQEPGIRLVGVEGASGSFSLEPYRDFPDPAMTKDIAEFLLKKGLIAGPEYAGLTVPKSPAFFGVENSDLYNANVRALKSAFKDKEAAIAWVDALKTQTEKLKETDYSEALKTFDRNFTGYQSEKVKLADYVRYLTTTLTQIKTRPVTPQLQMLMEALNQEEGLDFKRVEAERKQMVEKLVDKLSTTQIQKLVNKSVDYRAGRVGYAEYHTHLKQTCQAHGISMKAFPQMARYIAYVLTADKIDQHTLLNELDTVERTLPESLAKTSKEKELVAVSYDLSLLHKLVRHEMSPTDWTHYQARGKSIHNISERLAALGGKPSSDFALTPFEDFCRYAAERNLALTGNLAQQMADTKTNSSILIAGGFHTEGLSALLRQRQISYVVVTPKISVLPKDNNYLDVLARDPVPLEQLLAGDRIYLAKPIAMADAHSSAAMVIKAIEGLLRDEKEIVPLEEKIALTTNPGLNGTPFFTTQGKTIYYISNYSGEHPLLTWLSSMASIVSGALPQRIDLEGSFFVVRDIGNGKLEKEVKEIVGPKNSDERYHLSEEDRITAAALTADFTNKIRQTVTKEFEGRDLIPPFEVSGRIITTHKIDGKSFFDLIKENPRLADADWREKVRDQCRGAINAANKALMLRDEESLPLENGWRIQVDSNLENFFFDDAGHLIAWIDPISTWPPETKRLYPGEESLITHPPMNSRALSGALVDAYQNGRLESLSPLFPGTIDLRELENGLAFIAQDTIRKKMRGMDFRRIADAKGKYMNVYESTFLPGYIIKVPKEVDPSGNPIHFEEDILPGYRIAKQYLGGFFVIMALENISITIDGKPATVPFVILQERARPLSQIVNEIKQQGDSSQNQMLMKLDSRFDQLKRSMWERGVMDQDSFNELNNYGLTASGEMMGFDVDGIIRIQDFLETKQFPNTPRGQDLQNRILTAWESGKYKKMAGTRVHDVFEAEVRAAQEEWLLTKFVEEKSSSLLRLRWWNQWLAAAFIWLTGRTSHLSWQQADRLAREKIVSPEFRWIWAPVTELPFLPGAAVWGGVSSVGGLFVISAIFSLLHNLSPPENATQQFKEAQGVAGKFFVALKIVAETMGRTLGQFLKIEAWRVAVIRGNGKTGLSFGVTWQFFIRTGVAFAINIVALQFGGDSTLLTFVTAGVLHSGFNSITPNVPTETTLNGPDKTKNGGFAVQMSPVFSAITMAVVSATLGVMIAPIVMANFPAPMGAFLFVSLLTQLFDPTTVQTLSQDPVSGTIALLLGTTTNFSTYVFSLGWPAMVAVGAVGGIVTAGMRGRMPSLAVGGGPLALDQPAERATLMSLVDQMPVGSVLPERIKPNLNVPGYYASADFSGVPGDEIQQAIGILRKPDTEEKAVRRLGEEIAALAVGTRGTSRVTLGLVGYETGAMTKEDGKTALAALQGLLKANQSILLLSDDPEGIQEKLGLTDGEMELIQAVPGYLGISMKEVAKRYGNNKIPLSSIVLASEGAVDVSGMESIYQVTTFQSIAVSVRNAIDQALAVLQAA